MRSVVIFMVLIYLSNDIFCYENSIGVVSPPPPPPPRGNEFF